MASQPCLAEASADACSYWVAALHAQPEKTKKKTEILEKTLFPYTTLFRSSSREPWLFVRSWTASQPCLTEASAEAHSYWVTALYEIGRAHV